MSLVIKIQIGIRIDFTITLHVVTAHQSLQTVKNCAKSCCDVFQKYTY